jgi:hypothetical protein
MKKTFIPIFLLLSACAPGNTTEVYRDASQSSSRPADCVPKDRLELPQLVKSIQKREKTYYLFRARFKGSSREGGAVVEATNGNCKFLEFTGGQSLSKSVPLDVAVEFTIIKYRNIIDECKASKQSEKSCRDTIFSELVAVPKKPRMPVRLYEEDYRALKTLGFDDQKLRAVEKQKEKAFKERILYEQGE